MLARIRTVLAGINVWYSCGYWLVRFAMRFNSREAANSPKLAVTGQAAPKPDAQSSREGPAVAGFCRQTSPSSAGYVSCSVEYMASMPKRRLGLRENPYSLRRRLRTLANKGSWVVLLRSATRILVGSIWPPAPPAHTMGIFARWQ